MTEIPKEIAEALFATAKAVADNPLVKDMQNEFAKFRYVPIDSFYAAIPPLALKNGLFWRCRETEVGGEGKTFKFQYAFDLIHETGKTVESYDTVTIYHPAQGAQSSGSARSYADKLFMRTTFKVVTGERDSEYFQKQEGVDADATDNSNEEANAEAAKDAAKMKKKASKPVAANKKDSDASPMSVEEWRQALLGHPELPVSVNGKNTTVATAVNGEGANLILKVFETFMPRVNEYADAKSCVESLNSFYKGNKAARTALATVDVAHEKTLLGYFKAAKAAANNGEIWTL